MNIDPVPELTDSDIQAILDAADVIRTKAPWRKAISGTASKRLLKTIESTLIPTGLLICFLLTMANCTGPNQPLPKTPTTLHLDPAGRAVFRDGFRSGRNDEQKHLSANHKRHLYPSAFEEAFRCGYITGLTYNWFAFGKEDRIRREYPGYLDAYSKQLVDWTRTTATPETN